MFPHGQVKVLFVGTAVIDHVMEVEQLPEPHGTAVVHAGQRTFGGRGAGPAATYGMLGGRASMLAAVGSDFISSGFEQFLSDSSVDISLLSRSTADKCFSTNTYISMGTRAAMCFFEPRQLDAEPTMDVHSLRDTADAVYVAGYFSHSILGMAAKAARLGVPMALSLCNGIIPYVKDDLLNELVTAATIIAFNDDEWEITRRRLGINEERDLFAMTALLECVFHTRGTEPGTGSLRSGEQFDIPIHKVDRCQSALGAGDTFMAGVLYGHMLKLGYAESAVVGSLLASLKIEISPGATFPVGEADRVRERLASLILAAGLTVDQADT